MYAFDAGGGMLSVRLEPATARLFEII